MRSALFLVVMASLLPWSSSAQVPSIVESPTTSLQAGPHSWNRVLQNQSTSSLVAYMVGCNPKQGTPMLQDALLQTGASYVGPGRSIEVGFNNPSSCDAGVRAAIFSDGHVEGGPEFVGELFADRRGACRALGDTIKLLASVYTQHVPIADVIDGLDAERKSYGQKTPDERGGYNFVLGKVKHELAQPRVVNSFPSETLGQNQQLPAIEDVMKENGVSRDEASVILLNKRLEAWKSLLENHLDPPH
jgi:hypothetical protein